MRGDVYVAERAMWARPFHWDHVSLVGLRRLGLGWKTGVEDGFLMRGMEVGVFPLSIDGSKLVVPDKSAITRTKSRLIEGLDST